MRSLALALAGTGMAALLVATRTGEWNLYLLTGFLFGAAAAARAMRHGSTFLKIPLVTFGCEAVVLGLCTLARAEGVWPAWLADLAVPSTAVMTLALLVVLLAALWPFRVVRRCLVIADRYFDREEHLHWRLPGGATLRFPERRMGQAVVALTILMRQASVILTIKSIYVSAQLFDALQVGDRAKFWDALLVQMPLWATAWATLNIGTTALITAFAIRWRQVLAADYTRRWFSGAAHYRMTLANSGIDNPDQRIQEDVRNVIGVTEGSTWGVYNMVLMFTGILSSFLIYAIILWNLSESVDLFGNGVRIPGLLLWLAMAWAVFSTAVTIWIGRPVVPLSFEQQHVEADYRFGLARTREYSEQIALSRGGRAEQAIIAGRLSAVVGNAYRLLGMTAVMDALNRILDGLKDNLHILLLGPLVVAKVLTYGTLTIAASAFAAVNAVFNFVADSFVSLARFKAVVDRLSTFDAALDAVHGRPGGTRTEAAPDGPIRLSEVEIALPDGSPLYARTSLVLRPGENVLLSGRSGTGKSTLFRVLAGVWPSWTGTIALPPQGSLLVLPQKAYLPSGDLMTAVSYPRAADAYPPEDVARVLGDVGLGALAPKLHHDANWAQKLSGGEQQRLAVARAILARPRWLLLDEATSALDPALERQVYEALRRRLPTTTLVSIGHRESLAAYHARRLRAEATQGGVVLEDVSSADAPVVRARAEASV
ncbi:ABC transporter ATP-binding protein/permease [Methylorubrum thiocyanatum]